MLQQFLQEFGYFALFLGTFFEGETILVLAGFLAFRGYMDLKLVMIVAFLGSYAGDQLWYFLGRNSVIPPYGERARGGSFSRAGGVSYARAPANTFVSRSGAISRGGFGASAHSFGSGRA